ncbi:MAG: hypothetical protein HYX26_01355 [Acidobacteriales bacterium]|nr:hypothetical protein [Terriglobales bacterium]
MGTTLKIFPVEKFELLVRAYLDGIVEWEVLHNFAQAHIDDEYEPEFQRPIEDLHLMCLPEFRHDAESVDDRPRMRYLLGVLELLREDVAELGQSSVRERELTRIASEDPRKHSYRAQYRDQHRRKQ